MVTLFSPERSCYSMVDLNNHCEHSLQLFSDATGTPCGHTFCNNCINESLKSRQSCPLCNHKVNQRNLVKATSAELLAREFETMRQAYEGENVIGMSADIQARCIYTLTTDYDRFVTASFPVTKASRRSYTRLISKGTYTRKAIVEFQ